MVTREEAIRLATLRIAPLYDRVEVKRVERLSDLENWPGASGWRLYFFGYTTYCTADGPFELDDGRDVEVNDTTGEAELTGRQL